MKFTSSSDNATFDLFSPYNKELVAKGNLPICLSPPLSFPHPVHPIRPATAQPSPPLSPLPVSEATQHDVDKAVAAAQAAFPAWSALSPQERGKPLKKLAALILAERDELARLDAISLGRPVDSFFDDHYAATHFNYFAEAAYATGTSSLNTPGFVNISLRQP